MLSSLALIMFLASATVADEHGDRLDARCIVCQVVRQDLRRRSIGRHERLAVGDDKWTLVA